MNRKRRPAPARPLLLFIAPGLSLAIGTCPLQAATSWDGGGGTNWWFDPVNWDQQTPAPPGPLLPPAQYNGAGGVFATEARINAGTGTWDVTGEGVVYDPVNDPFFAAASGLVYPTGSTIAGIVGSDFGPEHLYRLYISRNTTHSNRLTIKSGDLVIDSSTIVGYSGSSPGNLNSATIEQIGGRVRLPFTSLDLGSCEVSGWGNGNYRYMGGTLEVSLLGGAGIRVAHGQAATGPSGVSRFVVGNGEAGHLRMWDFVMTSFRGVQDAVFVEGQDPNGIDRGVAVVEFVYQNAGTRPVQVARNLILNNGFDSTSGANLSSRLVLTLNEAPVVDPLAVPANLGLFDINFDLGFGDNAGTLLGSGDIDSDGTADRVFTNEVGSSHYLEGSIVSAVYANTRYDWIISYTGNISWIDADNSVVNMITGPGTGRDIVMIGLGSAPIAGLPGDTDGDGDIDDSDLGTAFANYTGPVGAAGGKTPADGDTDSDGDVDDSDLGTLFAGYTGPLSPTSVPEPAALALLGIGGLGLARRRNGSIRARVHCPN